MMYLFTEVSRKCSRITTEKYSTSFSSAIQLLHKSLRPHVYNIYGFVRFTDEIVDTFHAHDKAALLAEFKQETYRAISRGISLNPILQSLQETVNYYNIDIKLIDAFFYSMECDLHKNRYNQKDYDQYIYGSAEAVGLMCLYIFCEGDNKLYDQLKGHAQSLGAAFQKVNFLRDVKNDVQQLDRTYFPACNFSNFTFADKNAIEKDIQDDFDNAYKGISSLPVKARLGVYVAYTYYYSLFRKIKRVKPQTIFEERIRIPNYSKLMIVAKAGFRSHFNLL